LAHRFDHLIEPTMLGNTRELGTRVLFVLCPKCRR
jgi:hypothetical protein